MQTFDPLAFQRLKRAEENHFWFQVRRRWIFDEISKFIPPPATLLEVGCGTGNVCSFLATKGYVATGCEFYQEAITISWPGFTIIQGDAQKLSFKDNYFDIVGLFDVIEHFHDDLAILKETSRVLKKNGILVMTVPARKELWSCFDERACHKRRYTRGMLRKLLMEGDLIPLSIHYMFMALYLPMKFMRQKSDAHQDQFKINKTLNNVFRTIFNGERIVSKVIPLPIGTSLLAVARKAECL
jgi:ubiquinone/menaquinone biosynthesis C-methylase UbiE